MIAVAWALFALGMVHIGFGVLRFRRPLADAWSEGFVGRFETTETRRTAFWFLMAGPMLMGLGQIAVHAVATEDRWLLRTIGIYLLASGAIGVAAFPKSPLWAPLLLSPWFLAASFNWLG